MSWRLSLGIDDNILKNYAAKCVPSSDGTRSARQRSEPLSDNEIMEKIRDARKQGMEEAKYIKGLKHNELEIEINE
jgi:hypothetical protein